MSYFFLLLLCMHPSVAGFPIFLLLLCMHSFSAAFLIFLLLLLHAFLLCSFSHFLLLLYCMSFSVPPPCFSALQMQALMAAAQCGASKQLRRSCNIAKRCWSRECNFFSDWCGIVFPLWILQALLHHVWKADGLQSKNLFSKS